MARIGYARVSTADQDLDAQLDRLKAEGCGVVRAEKISGASRDGRTELEIIIQFLRAGDELVVTRLDRLGRDTRDVLNIVHECDQRAADRDGDAESASGNKSQAASRSLAGSCSRQSRGDSHRPRSWDEIEIGSLVLATTGIEDGWWEAIIESIDGDILTCRWRDYPTEPNVLRGRNELALLAPDQN